MHLYCRLPIDVSHWYLVPSYILFIPSTFLSPYHLPNGFTCTLNSKLYSLINLPGGTIAVDSRYRLGPLSARPVKIFFLLFSKMFSYTFIFKRGTRAFRCTSRTFLLLQQSKAIYNNQLAIFKELNHYSYAFLEHIFIRKK